MDNARPGGREVRLRMGDARQRLKARCWLDVIALGQAVDLLDVEDRIALHIVDFAVRF
jgi:hypothetical protein